MKRWFAPLVVGMALLYAALAVSAAGCLVLQAEESGHAHHTHAAHSTLCAWVCQVNPTVSIQAAVPLLAFFLVVVMQRLVVAASQLHFMSSVSRSRAPPSVIHS